MFISFQEAGMRGMVLFMAFLLAGCATVRQQDLDAWKDVPVEALDTHSLFITMPMYRTISSSGIEIRNYVNSREVASCYSGGSGVVNGNIVNANRFTTCSSNHIACNNIFYVKDGKVLEYVPRGRCKTNETVQPEPRWRRLAH
jgi:hypothetical protein